MVYNAVAILAIKIAIGNVEYAGLSSKDILWNSIDWLIKKYEETQDYNYLKKAVWHVYAYLELGYSYKDENLEFQSIIKVMEDEDRQEIKKLNRANRGIKINKTNIRNILGRWNPKLHSMRIDYVVEDIIIKVTDQQIGEYTYYSGKALADNGQEKLYEKTFKLYIKEKESILQDVCGNRYYELIEGE